jgi:membrane-associated phospholipid phosphatase
MDALFGTGLIEALQSAFSPFLDVLFIFCSLLGENYIYMVLIAITYWCLNKKSGVLVAYVLLASAYLNYWLKMSFSIDRPPSEYRIILKDEISYGFPSGHMQNTIAFWGWVGLKIGKARVQAIFPALVFLIGLSRIYLGVHYLGDVLGATFFGIVFLVVVNKAVPFLESKSNNTPEWLRYYLMPAVSVLLFGLSLVAFSDTAKGNSALVCGYLFGFSLGVSLESKKVKISMDTSLRTKVIRSAVGLVTVFGLYPVISYVLDLTPFVAQVYIYFVGYAIVAFTTAFIMPLIFILIEKH